MFNALPLTGIRALDLSWVVAGPYSNSLLAQMGAEVIKIESRTRPDFSRRSASAVNVPAGELEMSPRFAEMNLNKLGIQLDLQQPEARYFVKRLVAVSDAVVENFRAGVMDKLGLGYDDLRRINPAIIMLSSSVAGATGPDRDQAGYAPIFNAMSGLGYITGYEDGPPTELRASVDLRVAFTSMFALLSALYHRRRTGQGQYIDLASVEAVSTLIGHVFVQQQMGGNPERRGNRHETMAPHECYRCNSADAWVSIAASDDREWEALCEVIGQPELVMDPRFADATSRWENQDLLRPAIEAWTSKRTHWEATEALQAAGVPSAPSFTFEDLANDRHVVERDVTIQVEHPKMGTFTTTGVPWKLSALPEVPYRPAPMMGQHNEYVFREVLGLTAAELKGLAERQVMN